MRKYAIFMMLIAATSFTTFIMPGCSRFRQRNNIVKEASTFKSLIDAHNEIRKDHNAMIATLVEDPRLTIAAQKHAQYMADQDKISHFGEWYSRASDRIEKEGYNYWAVGENIAAGQRDVQEVMEDWMNSEPHKKNILNEKYTQIGVGVAENKYGRLYWCVVLAKPQY